MQRLRLRLAAIVFLGAALGLAGCEEQKKLPTRPTNDNRESENTKSLEGVRPAKEDPAAREVVKKAIAAHTNGKPERLDKVQAIHFRLKGEGYLPQPNTKYVDASLEEWSAWPNRFAFRWVYRTSEREIITTGALNPASGSMRNPTGGLEPFNPTYHQTVRWDMFILDWTLVPKALTHPDAMFYGLSPGVEKGKEIRTLKAYIPSLPELTLRFDASYLLTRVDYVGYETRAAAEKSLIYDSPVEKDGLKLPSHLIVGVRGENFWNLNTIETMELFDSADKIDPKKFEEP